MEYISYLILAGAQINYLQFCFQFCLREKTFVAKMTDVVLPVAVALSLCRLPSDSGPCGQWQKKYFYDHNAGHCRQFWYGGCGGTANRFNTMEDCSKICFVKKESGGGREARRWVADSRSSRADVCRLEPERGPCSDYSIKWHFVPQETKCRRFWYGGCQGNENRFDTEESCEARCLQKGKKFKLSFIFKCCCYPFFFPS